MRGELIGSPGGRTVDRKGPNGWTSHDIEVLILGDNHASVDVDADIRPGDTIRVGPLRLDYLERMVAKVSKTTLFSGADKREIKEVTLHPGGTVLTPAMPFDDLHPDIQAAARKLYMGGHYSEAISKAYLILELAIRKRSGLTDSGRGLMGRAFADDGPLDVRAHRGLTGDDEQAGFRFLFMGAATALRNPRAHELIEDDARTAFMHLVLLSFLMQRLDAAQCRGDES
jgi:uncharacterized protein (TIGR02391 family)